MLLKKEFKMVKLDDLESMAEYQRPLRMDFIEEKSKDTVFDKNEVEAPKISVRNDGTMKMGDGQHTVAIVRRRGWNAIRCELRYGLTIEEENDWFVIQNTKSQPQSQKTLLTAHINGTYEKNKDEQDFYKCLKSLGYKLNIYGEESGSRFKINCSASLLSLYKDYVEQDKKDKFMECMDIHKTCFKGDPISLQWVFIRGLFDFYEIYSENLDKSRFVSKLSEWEPSDIRKEAIKDTYTKNIPTRYARFFVSKYNLSLAKSKKLKMSKLED